MQHLKKYIFKKYKEKDIKFWGALSLSILSSILVVFLKHTPKTDHIKQESLNIELMIPKGYVLYPFEAVNFGSINSILGSYSMVQIYKPLDGSLVATNIKVLRAPKDPSHLAFLIPSSIASKLAPLGLEFKIAIQENTKKPPLWVLKEKQIKHKLNIKTVTFGE